MSEFSIADVSLCFESCAKRIDGFIDTCDAASHHSPRGNTLTVSDPMQRYSSRSSFRSDTEENEEHLWHNIVESIHNQRVSEIDDNGDVVRPVTADRRSMTSATNSYNGFDTDDFNVKRTGSTMSGMSGGDDFSELKTNFRRYLRRMETLFKYMQDELFRRDQKWERKKKKIHNEYNSIIHQWETRWKNFDHKFHDTLTDHKKVISEKEKLREERDNLLTRRRGERNWNILRELTWKEILQIDKNALEYSKKVLYQLLECTVRGLDGDRGSIFLYHEQTDQLVSLLLYPEPPMELVICIPSDKGIAGTVFTSAEGLNISNVYGDNRFYKKVDNNSGFVTKAIVCYPLFDDDDRVVGVVQVLNKKEDPTVPPEEQQEIFTVTDEATLNIYIPVLNSFLNNRRNNNALLSSKNIKENDEAIRTTGGNRQECKQVTRKTGQITVNRIGHAEEDNDGREEMGVEKPHRLIPPDIQQYIKKLETCWRKAVGDVADEREKVKDLQEEVRRLNTALNESRMQERMLTDEKDVREQKIAELEYDLKEKTAENEMQEIKLKCAFNLETEFKELVVGKNVRNPVKMLQRLVDQIMKPPETETEGDDAKSSKLSSRQSSKGGSSTASGIQLPKLNMTSLQNHQQSNGRRTPSEKSRNGPELSEQSRAILQGLSDSLFNYGIMPAKATVRRARTADAPGPRQMRISPSQQAYIDVFGRLPMPVCVLTESLRIWRCNKAFFDFIQVSDLDDEDGIIGRPFGELCSHPTQVSSRTLTDPDYLLWRCPHLHVLPMRPGSHATPIPPTARSTGAPRVRGNRLVFATYQSADNPSAATKQTWAQRTMPAEVLQQYYLINAKVVRIRESGPTMAQPPRQFANLPSYIVTFPMSDVPIPPIFPTEVCTARPYTTSSAPYPTGGSRSTSSHEEAIVVLQ